MRYARLSLLVLLCAALAPSARAGEDPPGLAPADLPYVEAITTVPAHPVDMDHVTLVVSGVFPYPCGELFTPDSTTYAIGLRPIAGCNDSIRTWHQAFDLGMLRAGSYSITLQLHVVADPAHPDIVVSVYEGRFEFGVALRDTTLPPPGLCVDAIRIQAKNLLPVERICPSDSIAVRIFGTFPSDCYSVKRVELIRIGAMGPPLVRVVVDDGSCLGRPCSLFPVPWSVAATLPPLPAGAYTLPVQVAVTSCADSFPPGLCMTSARFVVDSCGTVPPPGACLFSTWMHPVGPGQCDAFISPGHPAQVTLGIVTTVPLWGLQGRLVLSPPALDIVHLEAVGAASGMHLSWTRTDDGARFVMFAGTGAPISFRTDPAGPVPVLRVTTALVRRVPLPADTYVHAFELLGSDGSGNAVPECPTGVRDAPARICAGNGCDHNGDGVVDVRDLVLAVRCLRSDVCPDSAVFDCNGDARFTLDDVICCARRILGAPPCNDCAPDTLRHEPGVRLEFGTPVADGAGLALPLRLERASRIGAARFALRYPSDRYDVAGVEMPGTDPAWLMLHESQDGQVVVGLIRIGESDAMVADAPVDLVLRLTLRSGSAPGGEVTCAEGEFSGPDGVPLEITIESGVPLGGPARLALSEARPNPFAGTTRFSLTLSTAATVEVGVYDVTGRLVASLHRGPLGAGTREFSWDGRAGDGGPVPNGIYFARAVAGDQTVSRRMVLLRGN